MKNYQIKYLYLIDRQRKKYGMVFCPIFYKLKGRYKTPDALHHFKIHNTDINKKRYPLLIDSLLNLVPVFNSYHIQNNSWGKISEYQADKIERFLERHPKASQFVNNLEEIKYFKGGV